MQINKKKAPNKINIGKVKIIERKSEAKNVRIIRKNNDDFWDEWFQKKEKFRKKINI